MEIANTFKSHVPLDRLQDGVIVDIIDGRLFRWDSQSSKPVQSDGAQQWVDVLLDSPGQ